MILPDAGVDPGRPRSGNRTGVMGALRNPLETIARRVNTPETPVMVGPRGSKSDPPSLPHPNPLQLGSEGLLSAFYVMGIPLKKMIFICDAWYAGRE
jgi:hypothetical protein